MSQAHEIYASVDLGGTKIACGFGTAEGEILNESTVSTDAHEGQQAVLKRIADLVNDLAEAMDHRPAALGMGVPGLADLEHGVTRFLPNLPTQWRDVAVRDILSPQVGCPVYLLNDVRTATLGELTFGHGRTANTMVFFALGTGIGGGVAIDGKLRLGPLGAAGELGHHTILPDGPLCGCGNHGCVEALASGPAITAEGVRLLLIGQAPKLHEIVRGDLSLVSPKTMAEAAEAGETAIREAIVRAAQYLGIAVSNVVVTLHPDLIVLGGGVAGIGPLLFDTVRETMQSRVRMFPVDDIRIEPSMLGEKAGMLGGVALAMKRGLIA
jgi:glucokinase